MLVAQVSVFLQTLRDDLFQLGRNIGIQPYDCDRRAIHDGFADDRRAFSMEGHVAGSHFVKDRTKGKQIGAGIEVPASHLFRRHVGDGAYNCAGAGEVGRVHGLGGADVLVGRTGGHHFGEAKVEYLGVAALGDEDVGRLYVPVNNASGVGGVEGVGNLDRQSDQGVGIERAGSNGVFQG